MKTVPKARPKGYVTEAERRTLAGLIQNCGLRPVLEALDRLARVRAAVADGSIECICRVDATVDKLLAALGYPQMRPSPRKRCPGCDRSLAADPPYDIIVTVSGGVVQDVGPLPPRVRVVVHDYDTDGAEPEYVHTDASGDRYFEGVWARTCPSCNGEHPPCTSCGGVTRCDPEEPSEVHALCYSCEAALATRKGGAT